VPLTLYLPERSSVVAEVRCWPAALADRLSRCLQLTWGQDRQHHLRGLATPRNDGREGGRSHLDALEIDAPTKNPAGSAGSIRTPGSGPTQTRPSRRYAGSSVWVRREQKAGFALCDRRKPSSEEISVCRARPGRDSPGQRTTAPRTAGFAGLQRARATTPRDRPMRVPWRCGKKGGLSSDW
jgi:hypothetical protein